MIIFKKLPIAAVVLAAVTAILCGGCDHADSVVVQPEFEASPGPAEASPAPPESQPDSLTASSSAAMNASPSIVLLTPRSGAKVSQNGERVEFSVQGSVPEGAYLMVMVQDATGLDTNVWPVKPTEESPGKWSAGVQYGDASDAGATLSVTVILLGPGADVTSPGECGPFPTTGVLARSATSHVTRR